MNQQATQQPAPAQIPLVDATFDQKLEHYVSQATVQAIQTYPALLAVGLLHELRRIMAIEIQERVRDALEAQASNTEVTNTAPARAMRKRTGR